MDANLTARQLLAGYANGVFPMAESADDPRLSWYDPQRRGVLPVGGVHASRSLRRFLRHCGWRCALNHNFAGTVMACADRPVTWINAPLVQIYAQLHQAGFAHSFELYDDQTLIGGMFGVTLGGAFFGESMFSYRSNASKLVLLWASSHLARCGFVLFDTQFLTSHLATMGGQEIPRADYHRRLELALTLDADIRAHPLPDAVQLWQEITQTS